MTNLAIECSGTAGSVALFEGDCPIRYTDLDASLGSARTLAAAIEEILVGRCKPGFLSVTSGPGSFTGLRVGLTTAKMLALAWNIPVVPVDTLHAIALRSCREMPGPAAPHTIVAVINAFRGQVFAAAFRFHEGGFSTVLAPGCVLDAETWRTDPLGALGVARADSDVLVSGPGLKNYPLADHGRGPLALQTAPPEIWNPTANQVALLGAVGLAAGDARTAFTLDPNYIRASAAEEKSPR